MKYESVFDDAQDRSELVATFLAVLELIKGKRVTAQGEGRDTTLIMQKTAHKEVQDIGEIDA